MLLLLPLLFQNATVLKKDLLVSDVMKMENVSVRNHITLETNVTNVSMDDTNLKKIVLVKFEKIFYISKTGNLYKTIFLPNYLV